MKPLLVIMLIVFSALAVTAQTQHTKVKQNGEFASLTEAPDAFSTVNLQVSRNTDNTGTTANIFFQSVTVAPDFSSITIVDIIGGIPPTAFTGTTTQNLALALDVSQLLPGSFTENCVFALPAFTSTCGAPPTGQINLQFHENDAISDELVTAEEKIMGPVTIKTHARSDTSTAGVTGSILGNPVLSGASATVGVHHNSTLEFIHN
jgi:hypothetical protein